MGAPAAVAGSAGRDGVGGGGRLRRCLAGTASRGACSRIERRLYMTDFEEGVGSSIPLGHAHTMVIVDAVAVEQFVDELRQLLLAQRDGRNRRRPHRRCFAKTVYVKEKRRCTAPFFHVLPIGSDRRELTRPDTTVRYPTGAEIAGGWRHRSARMIVAGRNGGGGPRELEACERNAPGQTPRVQ
jgi:hypothetical protein